VHLGASEHALFRILGQRSSRSPSVETNSVRPLVYIARLDPIRIRACTHAPAWVRTNVLSRKNASSHDRVLCCAGARVLRACPTSTSCRICDANSRDFSSATDAPPKSRVGPSASPSRCSADEIGFVVIFPVCVCTSPFRLLGSARPLLTSYYRAQGEPTAVPRKK